MTKPEISTPQMTAVHHRREIPAVESPSLKIVRLDFVIQISSFLRHSVFGLRHSSAPLRPQFGVSVEFPFCQHAAATVNGTAQVGANETLHDGTTQSGFAGSA